MFYFPYLLKITILAQFAAILAFTPKNVPRMYPRHFICITIVLNEIPPHFAPILTRWVKLVFASTIILATPSHTTPRLILFE